MTTYREAAELLWGDAGAWLGDEYARHNTNFFDGQLPPLPMVIGITAYGACLAITRGHATPRITIASNQFGNLAEASDTLLHEMAHARLMLLGEDPRHNELPWCAEITRLSKLLGCDIVAKPIRPRRVPVPTTGAGPKTRVVRYADPGALTQGELGTWPAGSVRAGGYGTDGPGIAVDSY